MLLPRPWSHPSDYGVMRGLAESAELELGTYPGHRFPRGQWDWNIHIRLCREMAMKNVSKKQNTGTFPPVSSHICNKKSIPLFVNHCRASVFYECPRHFHLCQRKSTAAENGHISQASPANLAILHAYCLLHSDCILDIVFDTGVTKRSLGKWQTEAHVTGNRCRPAFHAVRSRRRWTCPPRCVGCPSRATLPGRSLMGKGQGGEGFGDETDMWQLPNKRTGVFSGCRPKLLHL